MGDAEAVGCHRVEHLMGMPIGIEIRGCDAAERLLDASFDEFGRVDEMFSLWRDDTPLARLVAGELRLGECPEEVRTVLGLAADARALSEGWFDPRRPDGVLDPTGIVKGWAIARVGSLLVDAGAQHWCVNAAGDVLASTGSPHEVPWRIGIEDPRDPTRLAAVVEVHCGGVATSGSAARGSHIWNPFTGRPADELLSCTVVCGDMARADVLATAGVARGIGAIPWLDSQEGVAALAVTASGAVLATRNWGALCGADTAALLSK